MKNLEFDPDAFEDLAWWIEKDRTTALKIMKLVREIQRDLFSGTGKPKRLKHDLRRINQEHHLIYQVLDEKIRILACRYHY